jgi:hypothetical protein
MDSAAPHAADLRRLYCDWLAGLALFVVQTEGHAARFAADGERWLAVALKSLAGGARASAWFWFKKIGGTQEVFDAVFKLAEESEARKEASGG